MQVLTYGLLSAAFLRLSLIVVGAELIENFQPVLLLFAGILLYSAYGLLAKNEDEDDSDLSDNQIVKVCRYVTPYPAHNFEMIVSLSFSYDP